MASSTGVRQTPTVTTIIPFAPGKEFHIIRSLHFSYGFYKKLNPDIVHDPEGHWESNDSEMRRHALSKQCLRALVTLLGLRMDCMDGLGDGGHLAPGAQAEWQLNVLNLVRKMYGLKKEMKGMDAQLGRVFKEFLKW